MENSCRKGKESAKIGEMKFKPKEELHKLLVRIGGWRELGRQGGRQGWSGRALGILGDLSLSSCFHFA